MEISSQKKSNPQPWSNILLKEMAAGVSMGLLYPFGYLRFRSTPKIFHKEQRTVIFIHGYMANPSCFYPLVCYLMAHGISQNILFFKYNSSVGIERAAIELRSFITRSLGGGRIDLVCHSLGGIIAQVFLQMLGGSRKVDRFITIGSPHEGTYNAYWVPSRIGKELRPGSVLLGRLKKTAEATSQVTTVAITGEYDNIVLPRSSAHTGNHFCIKETGHLGLLLSPQAMKLILNTLSQP